MYYTSSGTHYAPFLSTEIILHYLTDLQDLILIQLPIVKLMFLNPGLKATEQMFTKPAKHSLVVSKRSSWTV